MNDFGVLQPRCGCDDCESALSPGAYLANLLDYAQKHVRNNKLAIDLEFLETRFCQPFAELPIDCRAMDRKVHQARLAVEVLRQYVGVRPLFDAEAEKILKDAEADYRLTAYLQLLIHLGTNYEEIRRARSANTDDRKALAARLGITLPPNEAVPRNDALDQLYLDVNLPAADPNALTETALEQLFGLADTERDPLSEGIKHGDDQQQIIHWNFDNVDWNRNTAADGKVYLSIVSLAVDSYLVTIFSDSARLHLVASGEGKTPAGSIRLVPENGSGLSGIIEIDYKADDAGISMSLVSLMLGWQLSNLQQLWFDTDYPSPAPDPDFTPPIIDPQVIGLSDLRSARAGETAFDLWMDHYQRLKDKRNELKTGAEAEVSHLAGLEKIINIALSTPGNDITVANLDKLAADQADGKRIEDPLRSLGLTPAGFAFLMPLVELARDGQTIIASEWETIYDTLVFAFKLHEYPSWRTAEKDANLTLSPSDFRVGDDSIAPEQSVSLAVPLWISTRQARNDWTDKLEARIAQEATLVAGLESAVSEVEEVALPTLRDTLLNASDADGSTLADRAEWLTQRLLIDFRMSGSQTTTRVAQAIETLQELLFSLRTGQLEQDTLTIYASLVSIWAVAQENNCINLFAETSDNKLWQRVWDGRWRSWRSRGLLPATGNVLATLTPTGVAQASGRLDLFAQDGDLLLWHRVYDHGWLDWRQVDGSQQLATGGKLTAITRKEGQIDVFALANDGEVIQQHYDGNTWGSWERTGATSSLSPAAASWAADRVDLILALGDPTPRKPLHRWWDGAAWHDEPLDGALVSVPATTAWGVNRLDIFYNHYGMLYQKSLDGGVWQPWINLDLALTPGDPKLMGTPSVYSHAPGMLDVFALRQTDSATNIWRRHFADNAWAEWEKLPSETLDLDAPDFDEEWEWLGSYATWRSATFVYLYPDNLLQPSLITHQTPAFEHLVEITRTTRRISAEDACNAVRAYSSYLRDVSSLDIAATCQVETKFAPNDPCKSAATVSKNLLYMFGRTKEGKVYWSTIDPKDHSGYAQSFWDVVLIGPKDKKESTPKVTKIIGALPWTHDKLNQHYIYLFFIASHSEDVKLNFIRFDLDKNEWKKDEDLKELKIENLKYFDHSDPPQQHDTPLRAMTILPVQSNSVFDPPQLAIHLHGTTQRIYIRSLNEAGDNWQDEERNWDSFELKLPRIDPFIYNFPAQLEAALLVGGTIWVVYIYKDINAYSRFVSRGASNNLYIGNSTTFYGALPGTGFSLDSSFYLFYEDSGQIIYREISKSGGLGTAFVPSASLKHLAPHSGSSTPTYFVTPKPSEYGHSYAYQCKAENGELIGSSKVAVLPVLNAVYNVPPGLTPLALQAYRSSIKDVYIQNRGASASILTYLAEAYRHVPLQIALNQQASGEYIAALDWFTTVYDYRAPQGERYIDYGLEIDAHKSETGIFHHPEDWLLDPLNPHAIAMTRRYAYTRFTITSIIRCLNDFADAEFTQDTDESLVRARVLYTTALELCNVPELRQQFNACEALIGELIIQPGELMPPDVAAALGEIAEELTQGQVGSAPNGLISLEKIVQIIRGSAQWSTSLSQVNEIKQAALKSVPVPYKTGDVVTERPALLARVYSRLITDQEVEKQAKLIGDQAVIRSLVSVEGGQ